MSIRLRVDGRNANVPINQIEYVEGRGNRSLYHLIDGRVLVAGLTIAARQSELRGFVRIHKAFLINSQHVPINLCSSVVWTRSGRKLPVSRRYLDQLRQQHKQAIMSQSTPPPPSTPITPQESAFLEEHFPPETRRALVKVRFFQPRSTPQQRRDRVCQFFGLASIFDYAKIGAGVGVHLSLTRKGIDEGIQANFTL